LRLAGGNSDKYVRSIERRLRRFSETTRVFNMAALNRYEKAGIKKWRWLTALDERTCPVCMEKHGKVFSDPAQLPPHASHPNCRCTIVPYIETSRETARSESQITGDKELDKKITEAINEFEKLLKDEGNFSRALSRFVHGRDISAEEAEKLGEMYVQKYFGRDGGETVQNYIKHVLPYRINPKVLEKAGKAEVICELAFGYSGAYDPTARIISITPLSRDPARTFMHELGHHLEDKVCIEESRKFFIARARKHNYKLEPLSVHYEYRHIDDIYHYDGFDHVDPYAGSVYLGLYRKDHERSLAQILKDPKLIENPEIRDHLTTEMTSMGMEHFVREETMRELWVKDRELFGFILAILRG